MKNLCTKAALVLAMLSLLLYGCGQIITPKCDGTEAALVEELRLFSSKKTGQKLDSTAIKQNWSMYESGNWFAEHETSLLNCTRLKQINESAYLHQESTRLYTLWWTTQGTPTLKPDTELIFEVTLVAPPNQPHQVSFSCYSRSKKNPYGTRHLELEIIWNVRGP